MRQQFCEWWDEMEVFDRLGAGLVGWEFLSLGVGIVALPLAETGMVGGPVLLALAANSVGMGTAVVAWVLTHLLVGGRQSPRTSQTVRDWLVGVLRACRMRPRAQ